MIKQGKNTDWNAIAGAVIAIVTAVVTIVDQTKTK